MLTVIIVFQVMTIIVLVLHHNGSHDNHGMVPYWARAVFLHFLAKVLSMSKYITSDEVHELKINPSYLSLADVDPGSKTNILVASPHASQNAGGKSGISRVLTWKSTRQNIIKRHNTHHVRHHLHSHQHPDFDYHKGLKSQKEVLRNNNVFIEALMEADEPAQPSKEKVTQPLIAPKIGEEKGGASSKLDEEGTSKNTSSNNSTCPEQCAELWQNYKKALQKNLCLCKFNKQILSHISSSCPCMQWAENDEKNINRNNTEDDVLKHERLAKFTDMWRSTIKQQVNKTAEEVKPKGIEKQLEEMSSHSITADDIDSDKLMFNMCKRLNEFKNRMINDDLDAEVTCEWQPVAMVLDRFMFVLFTLTSIILIICMYNMLPSEGYRHHEHRDYYEGVTLMAHDHNPNRA